jgi:glycine cleavage system H protein
MASPKDLKFTKTHEWVRIEGHEATLGITDHAQSELGDITFIELPQIGAEFVQSDPLAAIESVKAASDIYAPVSGKVIAVNEALEDSPEKINQSPYGDGWIARLSMHGVTDLVDLMDAEAYDAYLEEIED